MLILYIFIEKIEKYIFFLKLLQKLSKNQNFYLKYQNFYQKISKKFNKLFYI